MSWGTRCPRRWGRRPSIWRFRRHSHGSGDRRQHRLRRTPGHTVMPLRGLRQFSRNKPSPLGVPPQAHPAPWQVRGLARLRPAEPNSLDWRRPHTGCPRRVGPQHCHVPARLGPPRGPGPGHVLTAQPVPGAISCGRLTTSARATLFTKLPSSRDRRRPGSQ